MDCASSTEAAKNRDKMERDCCLSICSNSTTFQGYRIELTINCSHYLLFFIFHSITLLQQLVMVTDEEVGRHIKRRKGMDCASSTEAAKNRDKMEKDCCLFVCGNSTTFQGYRIV